MGWLSVLAPIAGSLLGGALDNKNAVRRQRDANNYNDPAAIRKRYEAAGFNPLLGIANANPNQQNIQYQPQMGSLLSNAISLIQNNNIEQQGIDIEKSRLELDQKKNREYIERQTIRPKVAGIYGSANVQTPEGIVRPNVVSAQDVPSVVSYPRDTLDGRNPLPLVDTKPQVAPISSALGFELFHDPRFASGETAEEQYTEVGSYPYSFIKGAADVGYTFNIYRERAKRLRDLNAFEKSEKQKRRNEKRQRDFKPAKPHFRQLVQ